MWLHAPGHIHFVDSLRYTSGFAVNRHKLYPRVWLRVPFHTLFYLLWPRLPLHTTCNTNSLLNFLSIIPQHLGYVDALHLDNTGQKNTCHSPTPSSEPLISPSVEMGPMYWDKASCICYRWYSNSTCFGMWFSDQWASWQRKAGTREPKLFLSPQQCTS